MRIVNVTAAVAAVALGVRVVKSRHQRSLHPAGRTFTGELDVWGPPVPVGSDLIDQPARHPVTVRMSKGAGTRGDRLDVLGMAIRVHGAGHGRDLLLSTTGTGLLSRYLPVPRRTFDTVYGSIMPFRSGTGTRLFLTARPDPDAPPVGRTLESVAEAAGHDRATFLLYASSAQPFGRISLGAELSRVTDDELAFDPIRNQPADLHPSGPLTAIRAVTYRISRRWRGATAPAEAVTDVDRSYSAGK